MVELQASDGSLEVLANTLTLARTLGELPFDLNLWQAQNIWYEVLRSSAEVLISFSTEDRQRWEKDFTELGACLSIDTKSIRAEEESRAAAAD